MSLPASTAPDVYFATARTEILPWLPQRVTRMLDLGCGAGSTVAAVKHVREVSWAGGIELMPEQAKAAEQVCERVWTGDIKSLPIEDAIAPLSLDLVLCLDVLEHLVDPWSVVARLSALIAPGGRLIVSVPNVRNYRFIWRLLMRGDFRYRDFGLLDRTHLRFFTRATAVELAKRGGLGLISAHSVQSWRAPDWRWMINAITNRRADELLAKQWLVVVERPFASGS
jgi:2-polyprenyl-3-methyl-5-hydroxy-6-metoxy-1,4-benzoquinol methylase